MASERDEVLKAVIPEGVATVSELQPSADTKLQNALTVGEETRRLQMSNEHEINRLNAELGWFGKVFGSESHAAMVIAFVMIILGFGTAIGLWVVAYKTGKTDFWSSEAHLSLAAATSALGYVFGRGSKDTK
jgi:hypothetical protein